MKYVRTFYAAVCIVLFMAVLSPVSAETMSVEHIVHRSNYVAYYQDGNGRAKVNMSITDEQGRDRTREFTVLRWDEKKEGQSDEQYCGDQKYYVYFHLPADVNRMVFMVWKHTDIKTDDDRWLYLPALDLVKRISSNEKRTSFVGSDFFYEDVSGRNINLDTHELTETTEADYVLKNTPKFPDNVEFSYYTMRIDRKNFITKKVEYFDKKGEKYRVYEVKAVETIKGYPTVTRSVMKDLKKKSKTVLEYSDIEYGAGIPENIFTERFLRRPPTRYLRR